MKNIAVIVGSLRKDSLNRKMATALMDLAPDTLSFEMVEIGDLPLYNEDLEVNVPTAWARFREQIPGFDGLLFVTPEYNRSIPAALKNALDVGSRPYGKSVWSGKPAAIMTVSPGAIGGFGANHHLRQPLVFLNVPTMQQPEAYIGHGGDIFDAQGTMAKGTKEFAATFMRAFAAWVRANSPA